MNKGGNTLSEKELKSLELEEDKSIILSYFLAGKFDSLDDHYSDQLIRDDIDNLIPDDIEKGGEDNEILFVKFNRVNIQYVIRNIRDKVEFTLVDNESK